MIISGPGSSLPWYCWNNSANEKMTVMIDKGISNPRRLEIVLIFWSIYMDAP